MVGYIMPRAADEHHRSQQNNNTMFLGVFLCAAHLLYFASADVVTSNSGDAGVPVIDSSSVLNYKTFSCNCPLIYKPVCGSDGKTYSNDCVLKCASDTNVKNGLPPIYILKFGECPQVPCFCPAVVQPVCGSDSHTYSNECNLICESNRRQKLGLPAIYVVSQGSCSYFPCLCSNVIIPVCGTDGRTYRNICFLQCASKANQAQGLPPIFYQNSGACLKETCQCTLDLNPVCASDGKTYDNNCLLQCENRRRNALGLYSLYIIKQGPCTSCNCPNINDPVCASDDKTYKSPCFLNCENEARKKVGLPPLTILYKGVCGCNCNKKYEPVCGTDEITYDNLCLLQCESNKRVYQGQSPIFLAYFGQCVCNCRNCTTFFQPVCGSDAKTYWNICWLNCYSACNVKQGKPKITLVKYGYC